MQQSKNERKVLKWKAKCDIFMLSTCHDNLVIGNKPAVVEAQAKLFVDTSDHMAAY